MSEAGNPMRECGFIGLGRMGGAMSRRLIEAGHRVVVFDSSASARDALAAQGASVAASARAVADAVPVVFLSLPSPKIVVETMLGAHGAGAGARLQICVDLSTSGPEAAIRLAAGLSERNIASLEAPVSGGIKGAREGTLSLMVSGPASAWEQVRPLLEIFGRPFFMGETAGAGQTMKLVNNLLGACAIAITAEGMTIGAKAGLDPKRMIEVLNVSTGRNSATQDKWPRAVLPRTFDFGFASGLCLKDVRLCLAAARELGVPLGVGTAVCELLERTVDAFGADSDFTAMTKIVEIDAGMDPERSQN
jgi:3-hydroxyisobutyrate dehydrogenase-like beta-hydroxyacid dehydrogenase